MIKIDIQALLDDPNFETWKNEARIQTQKVLKYFESDDQEKKIKENSKLIKKLKDFLVKHYQAKCMYCEGKVDAQAVNDMEHYRPKKKVTENRKVVEVTKNGKTCKHRGYYWLHYQWYNLVISCQKCNRWDGKVCEFPISGTRVAKPSEDQEKWQEELEKEKPLLLHPYFDDPAEHIRIQVGKHGMISPKTDKGKKTIEILKLNRTALADDRASEVKDKIEHELRKIRCSKIFKNGKEKRYKKTFFKKEKKYSFYLNQIFEFAINTIEKEGRIVVISGLIGEELLEEWEDFTYHITKWEKTTHEWILYFSENNSVTS